jgi:hypothetical protein
MLLMRLSRVRIFYDRQVARHVRRRLWHPTQEIISNIDEATQASAIRRRPSSSSWRHVAMLECAACAMR